MKKFDAKRFAMLLYEKGIKKKELAKRCGIGHTSICYYAKGKVTPSADKLYAISKELGCAVEDLLADESEKMAEKITAIDIAKELIDRKLAPNDLAEIAEYLLVYADHRNASKEVVNE